MISTRVRLGSVALAGVAATLLAACSGSSDGPADASSSGAASSAVPTAPSTVSSSPAGPAGAATAAPTGTRYVSIGDSYAAGYQPGGTTRNGFAYQVVTKAAAKGVTLTLTNFGCSGATTVSALSGPGCPAADLGPGASRYTQPQVAAAEAFLRAHRGQVRLVTVSLGGNDVTACADSTTTATAQTCVVQALTKITANIKTIVGRLRAAAGPTTEIVGLTYPDVFLGAYLSSDPQKRQIAQLSVTAFKLLINPQLQTAYASAGGRFVDVTAATGAYGSFSTTTSVPGYGSLPAPVAQVCRLTYFCSDQDIHPRTNGYSIIADLVVKALA